VSKSEITLGSTDHDPLAILITKTWNWPYWVLPSLFLVSAVLVFLVLGDLLGFLRTNGDVLGSLDDPRQLIISFFIQPLIVAYYLWLPRRTWEMFESLARKNVIPVLVKSITDSGKCVRKRI
jgi:membrane-bound metal-dependent hydrolase YbcI (DUF457 family)